MSVSPVLKDRDKWEHLFIKGEYPEREKILSGLKLADVIKRPKHIKNSMYDELWHMDKWQNSIVLNEDELDETLEYEKWKEETNRFPKSDPSSQAEWDELVKAFLKSLYQILERCESKEKLNKAVEKNFTFRDVLYSLSIHNAYHFGKILALRQVLGLWPEDKIKSNQN